MLSKSCRWLLLAVMVACVTLPAFAAEGERDEDRRPADRDRERDRDRGRDRRGNRADRWRRFAAFREALRKRQNGEKLTQDEQAALDRLQRFRRDAGDPAADRGKPSVSGLARFKHDSRLNVIDDAYYRIAEVYIQQKEYINALESLQRLIKSSPDKLAVSLTHLNLAELYRKELNNKENAIAEYKKVTGEYAIEAQRRLATLFEELNQIDEAVAAFEAIVKTAPDKMHKVLALRELAELLFRNDRADEAVATLQQLTKAVSYAEAKDITKQLLEAEEQREKAAQQERERERAARVRTLRDRFRGWQPPGRGDREMRPDRARPPRDAGDKDARPTERPIRPDAPK